MAKEIVTINVGEGGINFGNTVWRQYNVEHDINQYGIQQTQREDNTFLNFYNETESGKYIPRTLMIDTDPDTINRLKASNHSKLYHNEYLISEKEDAANLYTRGHYSVGKALIDEIVNTLRNMVEAFDNLDGFIINHAIGGGTGSGLTTLMLERLAVDYRKKCKIGFPIYPFYTNHLRSNCVIEPYNSLLTTHQLLDHNEISIVFDNNKIYDLCKNKLNIDLPSYHDMNLLMAKIESSFTSPLRLKYEEDMTGGINCYDNEEIHLNGYQTILVPFPRLHFMIPALAPLFDNNYDNIHLLYAGNKGKILIDGFVRMYRHNNYLMDSVQNFESPLYEDLMNLIYKSCGNYKTIMEIIDDTLTVDHFMIDIDDFDYEEDKYMGIVLNSHGFTDAKEINSAICAYKHHKACFVDWSTCTFHVSMDHRPIGILPDDTLDASLASVAMIGNNTGIWRYFQRTICHRYDKLYSQQAFTHWIRGEGMEKYEFEEARQNLEFLRKDYLDVLSEQPTDFESDDD